MSIPRLPNPLSADSVKRPRGVYRVTIANAHEVRFTAYASDGRRICRAYIPDDIADRYTGEACWRWLDLIDPVCEAPRDDGVVVHPALRDEGVVLRETL